MIFLNNLWVSPSFRIPPNIYIHDLCLSCKLLIEARVTVRLIFSHNMLLQSKLSASSPPRAPTRHSTLPRNPPRKQLLILHYLRHAPRDLPSQAARWDPTQLWWRARSRCLPVSAASAVSLAASTALQNAGRKFPSRLLLQLSLTVPLASTPRKHPRHLTVLPQARPASLSVSRPLARWIGLTISP